VRAPSLKTVPGRELTLTLELDHPALPQPAHHQMGLVARPKLWPTTRARIEELIEQSPEASCRAGPVEDRPARRGDQAVGSFERTLRQRRSDRKAGMRADDSKYGHSKEGRMISRVFCRRDHSGWATGRTVRSAAVPRRLPRKTPTRPGSLFANDPEGSQWLASCRAR